MTKLRDARTLLAAEMGSEKQRRHITGDGSASYATVTANQALRAIEQAQREALEAAVAAVYYTRDNVLGDFDDRADGYRDGCTESVMRIRALLPEQERGS